MTTPPERLLDIAKRLDDLADEFTGELSTISEELGEIAEKWPNPAPTSHVAEIPRYLAEIQQIVERTVLEQDPYYRDRMRWEAKAMAQTKIAVQKPFNPTALRFDA